jgi:hypothetical protein
MALMSLAISARTYAQVSLTCLLLQPGRPDRRYLAIQHEGAALTGVNVSPRIYED